MRDEPNLLAGILANPDDDAPRLVYADWLDEHGQPDRAEFIRVQIERARTPHWHPKRPGLDRRNRDLIGEFQLEWAKPLLDMGVPSWQYRRGFLEHAEMDAQQFIRDGDELLRVTMVRSIKALGDADWEALCSMHAFEQMHGWCCTADDGDDFVHHMAKCDGDLALRSLQFQNAGLSDASFDELVNLPVPFLHTLDLGRASIDAEELNQLSRGPLGKQLRALLLDGVASNVAAFLERAKLPALRHLAVDVDTIQRLFARPKTGLAVPCLASLQSLSIGLDPRPHEFDWSVLAKLPALRWLGLGILVLNDAPLRAFVGNLNARVVKELVLLRHQVLDEAALRRGYHRDHATTFVLDADLRITNQDEWFEEMGFNSPNATVTLRGFGNDQTPLKGAWPSLVNTSEYFWELETKVKIRELQRIVIHDPPKRRDANQGMISASWPSFLPNGLPQAQQYHVAFDGCVEWLENLRFAVYKNGTTLEIWLDEWNEEDWQMQVNMPVFANVRELVIAAFAPTKYARFVQSLAESPYANHLQTLRISECSDGDEIARIIATIPLPWLRSLEFHDGRLTTQGIEALVRSPHFVRITHLAISGTRVSWQSVKAIAEAPNLASLRALYLCDTELDEEAARFLITSPYLRWLILLDLKKNLLDLSSTPRSGSLMAALLARFNTSLGAGLAGDYLPAEPDIEDAL